jgi:UDP-3-O-[3-hydroxymyristoyl] glucosamine N-acyltransferase
MGGHDLGADCRLGDDVGLCPHVVLYRQTQLGHRVAVHAGTIIGSDGFGYVLDQGRHRTVFQLGNVIIHDDVEIGANSAIDRGTLGPTIIG